ncbi:glutathione S-transferase [Desulfuromusa kysingii]|uniref:Glutathione S-transferase n=1 Tax=Desulfuromusa kysingii TaxID=37625 RepID=A0A1H4BE27_9BACT|nr:glutathione S-transferase family protein [Desulfuromusa kysingii]SEA46356.1 glutathione S-transferase [Desulfuromusa kysingii]
MNDIELFSARVCPFAHRSRLALMEKNLPFTLIEINLHNKPDWFLNMNPAGSVPALRQGDFVLHESLVINEYINECFSEIPLLPQSMQKRAEARQWISYAGASFVPAFYRTLKAQDEDRQERSIAEMYRVLETLDNELKRSKGEGPYWYGWQVGLTDIAFYPWFERWILLEHYRGLKIPDQLHSLLDWIAAMQGRDAVKLGGEPVDYYIGQYAAYAAGKK